MPNAGISLRCAGINGDIEDFLLDKAWQTRGVTTRAQILRFPDERPHPADSAGSLFAKTDFLDQGDEPRVRAQAVVDGIGIK